MSAACHKVNGRQAKPQHTFGEKVISTAVVDIVPGLSLPENELVFLTSRSGGPGGQNVNKLETRVEVRFDVVASSVLSADQKAQVLERLQSRIDKNGVLRVVSQASRSQWQNKQTAVERLTDLLRKALRPRKTRKPTKPSRVAQERRLKAKKVHSERKRNRRRPLE